MTTSKIDNLKSISESINIKYGASPYEFFYLLSAQAPYVETESDVCDDPDCGHLGEVVTYFMEKDRSVIALIFHNDYYFDYLEIIQPERLRQLIDSV